MILINAFAFGDPAGWFVASSNRPNSDMLEELKLS
jgi:hypothetical protein